MRHRYHEFDGEPFRFQSDIDHGAFLDFILAHGDEALRALKELERDPEQSELLQQLLNDGLLEKMRGRFRLTPRAVRSMERRAMMEVFASLRKGLRDGHASQDAGGTAERADGTRPYQFGDTVSDLDIPQTLRNAVRRAATNPRDGESAHRGGARVALSEHDFEVGLRESQTTCSTVVLLDQSGSMARFRRFVHAKRAAMSMIALIRQRFPLDTIDLVGFHSGADAIAEDRLPLLMPKPVTRHDPVIRMRVPLDRLDEAPPHFTNLQLGLMHARRLLRRRNGENKLIFIITDGQPTAHVKGDYAYLVYPPSEESHVATLQEGFLAAKDGARICIFALTDDYWDMDWLGFVDDLARLTRGVAFQTASGDAAACVMQSYISGRRRKAFLG